MVPAISLSSGGATAARGATPPSGGEDRPRCLISFARRDLNFPQGWRPYTLGNTGQAAVTWLSTWVEIGTITAPMRSRLGFRS